MGLLVGTRRALLGGRAIVQWWDPNNEGLPVVGAYRAIATAGSPWPLAPTAYADTLQNWSNPGTNDLVEGNGAVPWAANTGWQFATAATQYFNTALVPANDQSWSMLAQFSNVVAVVRLAVAELLTAGGDEFGLNVRDAPNNTLRYENGGRISVVPTLNAGNMCVAGNQGYRNGIADGGAIGVWVGVNALSVYIGARNNVGVADRFITANIRAVALYNQVLTAPQVLAVATAMAAL